MNNRNNAVATRDTPEIMQPAVANAAPQATALEMHELIPRMELARRLPRSPALFSQRLQAEVLIDPGPMVYHKPGKDEDGRDIELIGPSVRMAEIAGRLFGNLEISEPTITESDGRVVAVVRVLDLESNYRVPGTSAVSLITRSGKRMSPHVVSNLVLAAASKALRNAIEKVVGKHVLKEMVELCLKKQTEVAAAAIKKNGKAAWWAGETATWAKLGVSEADLFVALGVTDLAGVTPEHSSKLRAVMTTIKQERVDPRVALGLDRDDAPTPAASEDDDFFGDAGDTT